MKHSTGIVLGLLALFPLGCMVESGSVTDETSQLAVASCAPAYTVKTYVGGERVQNVGTVYECKPFPYSGWCGIGGPYEPGVGFAWRDAWIEVGPCDGGSNSSGGSSSTGGSSSVGGSSNSGGAPTSSGGSGGGSTSNSDPTCETGIVGSGVCCAASCGTCGGSGCSGRPGGAQACCSGTIKAAAVSCSGALPPCVLDEPPSTGFTHPGLTSTGSELNRVRSTVNGSASHPMKDGWNKLRSTRFAQLSYSPTPFQIVHVVGSGANDEEKAMRNDAVAAYAHTLQWVVTRDARHGAKAMDILRTWSTTLQDVQPVSGSPSVQDELEVAWYAPIWLASAEILRNYEGGAAGWSQADQGSFDSMVSLFRRKADAWSGSQGCCPNQALSVIFSRMSIAVYTNDRPYLDAALDYFRSKVLPRSIASSGEVLEINRISGGDCGHASYNIEAIFDIAEVAWHQGIDLYSDSRLPLGLEYMAQCITSGVQTSNEGFVTCSTMRPNSVEIANNHYKNRVRSHSLPYTQTLLSRIRPVDQGTGKFIPWDTLTHAGVN